MHFIQYGKQKINYAIKRGNRKRTVAIHIDPMAAVIVIAPPYLDDEKIRGLVQKRARWIVEKQRILRKNHLPSPTREFVSGEAFPYLGREYRLKVIRSISGNLGKCELLQGKFRVEVDETLDEEGRKKAIKKALLDWYLAHGEEKIREHVDHYSRLMGERPKSIEIKKQKRRWGSCSRNGVVRFNWKIIMMPVSVIDYLILHELCHLVYPYHSPQFWQKIESILPAYKKKRDWLKQFSQQQMASFD
jgi:predicted metal-dependent hydrolase